MCERASCTALILCHINCLFTSELFSCGGEFSPVMSRIFTSLQMCVCVRVFACVTELASMVCPSPMETIKEKLEPSQKIVREKCGALMSQKDTFSKTFWGILDFWWDGDGMNDRPSVGNRWASLLPLRKPFLHRRRSYIQQSQKVPYLKIPHFYGENLIFLDEEKKYYWQAEPQISIKSKAWSSSLQEPSTDLLSRSSGIDLPFG